MAEFTKTVTVYLDDGETDVDFPARYVVCYDCRGKGTTYLGWASKDQPAFTAEDFAYEGPDFVEDYFSGHYDSQCPACRGEKVILEIVEKAIKGDQKELWKAYQDQLESDAICDAISEGERRMGA